MDNKLPNVRPVYSYIVDSVIANARAHFLQDGIDECVLACDDWLHHRITVQALCVYG